MTDDNPPETFFLAARDSASGERWDLEMSAGQTLDACARLRAGKPGVVAYVVGEGELLADEDGELVHRESAIPRLPDPREDRR